ncbi:MAG: hypothetical protein PHS41_12805 [Victivallaceae bacterium]|nr:hypothetical protein [Victivallaceae bacterium]
MAETFLPGPFEGKKLPATWKCNVPESAAVTDGVLQIASAKKETGLRSAKFPLKPDARYYAVMRMRSLSGPLAIRAGFVGNRWKWVATESCELSGDWQWYVVERKSPAALESAPTVWAQFAVPAGKKIEVSDYGFSTFSMDPAQFPDTLRGAPGSYPEGWFPYTYQKIANGESGLSDDFQTDGQKLTMRLCARNADEIVQSAILTMPKSGKVNFTVKMRSADGTANAKLFLIGDNYKWCPSREVTVTDSWQTFVLAAQFPMNPKNDEFRCRVDVRKGGEIIIADLKIELVP